MLAAAEFVTQKLQGADKLLYERWLQELFFGEKCGTGKMAEAIRSLRDANIPLATLNYDTLLEQATDLPGITLSDTSQVVSWMQRDHPGILHLHGKWDVPGSCILGIRDYTATLTSEVRSLIQRSLSSFGQLLFVGCGDTFSDPNFSALINWCRTNIGGAPPLHYAFVTEKDYGPRKKDQAWQGFVDPISYPNHADLPAKLLEIVADVQAAKRKPKRTSSSLIDEAQCLDAYRTFLIRDCGQMTIEGVRADMDTAQRKFDLERLFVPLDVVPIPPEFPLTDPKREQKLSEWQESDGRGKTFGEAFRDNRRIALLAFPGGGKTLLLKRLAVAYAEPKRRKLSRDQLPDVTLFPVMIRCREWRDHIQKPIPTILNELSQITGQTNLSNFWDAIVPMLRRGNIILLVDGLDEIHVDAHRTTFVEHLERFLEDYPKIRLVVTSREAGFALIAPTLARFCQRWRVAPLSEEAIALLCDYWHKLMAGDKPEALAEAAETTARIMQSSALRRLAENPLLLTMLLVVKHGAGRLPPDRVSLYDRAVEVLLDTWNIKGHEALNVKEAVPQLAYVAFELHKQGKQTATEHELIKLLEAARKYVPQITRYARDTPHDFVKRVELRSSLLVEAGLQKDGHKTVPFYQFRHLTFQEYLAAVAAVEGHYRGYTSRDTPLTPLNRYLEGEEWKEVVPMAAVLARKQAEPLLVRLNTLAQKAIANRIRSDDDMGPIKLENAVQLLLTSLAEEAEASPDTLSKSLEVLALLAKGCRDDSDLWRTLAIGPYGIEFEEKAWQLYTQGFQPESLWLRNTYAVIAAMRLHNRHAVAADAHREVMDCLQKGTHSEEIRRNFLAISGDIWSSTHETLNIWSDNDTATLVEQYILSKDSDNTEAALWARALLHDRETTIRPKVGTLELVANLYFLDGSIASLAGFFLGRVVGFPRAYWKPQFDADQKERIVGILESDRVDGRDRSLWHGALVLSYYARGVVDDSKLGSLLEQMKDRSDVANLMTSLLAGKSREGSMRVRRPSVTL
ncbi:MULTISPECIES: SIR2 family protein [Mesorhizobium]|nr:MULTISPECIES: SIR2 family protein [Mesorhizobium]MCQ8814375.1 SIR2 family protein [Mesorhizobium sp. SEMIA396]